MQNSNQIAIDFSSLHHIENTIENQNIFDANQKRFSNQCRIVYDALLRGEKLTTGYAQAKYEIGDLRARIRDLINFDIPVKKKLLKGRYKEYYLEIKKD